MYLQVFHCVHFESPADTSVGSLINSVAQAAAAAPNSPRPNPLPQQGPMFPPVPEPAGARGRSPSPTSSSTTSSRNSHNSNQLNPRQGGPRLNFGPYYGPPLAPGPQQQGPPLMPQPFYLNHQNQGLPAPPQGMAEPIPPALGAQYAGHLLQQQDVPEADRVDNR